QTSLFHRNMTNIGIVHYFNAFLHAIARTILFLFQFKLVLPDETHFMAPANIVITFASILRSYQMMATVFLFSSFVTERTLATIYLYDYEKNKRFWISYLLIFLTFFLSLSLSIVRVFGGLN
ncbi:hypothetical protein PMAYCL1PPCAC_19857, partial [Pristionchus mayeri]